jgi:glycosyltransferase involved in cell wall biosynthesis
MNKRIKILFTIPNFDTAGSGRVVYDLAKGIDTSKFEVHIACSHSNGPFFETVKQLSLPIHIIETTCELRPYYSLLTRIKPYKDFIKTNNFDIVHSWHWSSDWTEVIGARWGGAKFVFTKKAMSWGNIHWKIKSHLSSFIITLNDDMDIYFPYKRNRKLIPLGIDVDLYKSKFENKKQSKIFKIITVANLVPVKGIEVLIKALTLLKNKNFDLTILGDDNTLYANDLKQKVESLKLSSQVHFSGKQMHVASFLETADLYVIPSFNEGMPMALVEAMCIGLPVLGSDISGIKFVLKDFKELLFEAGNSIELAKKIDKFMEIDINERQNLGFVLRNYVVDNFSMEAFLAQHQELYLSLD